MKDQIRMLTKQIRTLREWRQCCPGLQALQPSKGNWGLFAWIGLDDRDNVPRIAEDKYLKLLYRLHEEEGTLDIDLDCLSELCDRCDLGHLCPETALTVLCLESIFPNR